MFTKPGFAGITRVIRLWATVALLLLGFSKSGNAACALTTIYPDTIHQVANITRCSGPLDQNNPNGTRYLIDVPSNWNSTLILWSHPYAPPRATLYPATIVYNPAVHSYLLSNGYAAASSSFAGGWSVQDALTDQLKVLDVFPQLGFGAPTRTIAWGGSLGGLITAGLAQEHPERFDGAAAACAPLAGSVGLWNTALDMAFAFKTLLAPESNLQVVGLRNVPLALQFNLPIALQYLDAAQGTPRGRARIALVAALGDIPGWFGSLAPEPDATDYSAQEASQYLWFRRLDFGFLFAFRADLEQRAGDKNPSWNTGVNYAKQLEMSVNFEEVKALYEQAGLDLGADLQTLEAAPRVAADDTAVDYLRENVSFTGDIQIPILTVFGTGDGLVAVENGQAYKHVVAKAHETPLLRQLFVRRAGNDAFHCTLTPAEQITALQLLIHRLDEGHWRGVGSDDLNAAASSLDPGLNALPESGSAKVPPAFVDFDPAPFLRPFIFDDEP